VQKRVKLALYPFFILNKWTNTYKLLSAKQYLQINTFIKVPSTQNLQKVTNDRLIDLARYHSLLFCYKYMNKYK